MIHPQMEQAFATIAEQQFTGYLNTLPDFSCRLLLQSTGSKRLNTESELIARGNFGSLPQAAVLVILEATARPLMLKHLARYFLLENRYQEAGENIWYFFAEGFFRKISNACQQAGIPATFQSAEIVAGTENLRWEELHGRRSEYLVTIHQKRSITCRTSLVILYER